MGRYTEAAAEKALSAFIEAGGLQEEEMQNNIVDLMTNLLHIADEKEIPAEFLHSLVWERYELEPHIPHSICEHCGQPFVKGAAGHNACPCTELSEEDDDE